MNQKEHLMTVLMEECAEVQSATSKALRFGVGDSRPGTINTNSQEIAREFIEATAVRDMLRDLGVISEPADADKIYHDKQERVRRYIEYAKCKGTITECK